MARQLQDLAGRFLSSGESELSALDRRLLERIAAQEQVSRDVASEAVDARTFGERVADRVAELGGSWTFIGLFGLSLLVWASVNTWVLAGNAFDPYPYIFLNLLLSMLASVQAPLIMMSQNRQAAMDRAAAAHDYEVNLKAELEIMALHEKFDALRTLQIEALLASQQEQLRLLTEVVRTLGVTHAPTA